MEGVQEEIHGPQENLVKIVEAGPKLIHIIEGNIERENIVRSKIIDPITFKPQERVFTEQEGIKNLIDFIDATINTAKNGGDAQIEEKARLFKDNLVFVGEIELKKAIQGIAQHLLEEAQNGKSIILFPANVRSERYISLRILEELDRLTESVQELRQAIKVTESFAKVTQLVKVSSGNCLIAVPDDFVVSGTRIQGFAGRIYNSLLEAGFAPNRASEMIEANVVAMGQRAGENKLTVGRSEEQTEKDLRIFSYYGIPEYKDTSGKWVVFTGVSFTGVHSSTDYGFEMELEEFQKYMKVNGLQKDLPLLHNIKRPYETVESGSPKYVDGELQLRWEKFSNKYG